MDSDLTRRIAADPSYRELKAKRTRLGWVLTIAMLLVYYGFILLVAFAKPLMAAKVGGGATSVGIVLGLGVIIAAFLLTGIYVQRANGRFDEMTRELAKDVEP